jgi:hypothetical protein
LAKMLTVVEVLESDNNAHLFRKPVDYKKMELFDYPKIIHRPMDLSTVKVRNETKISKILRRASIRRLKIVSQISS